ncbi:MAG: aldo/keto reductase [Candidatus Hydrogenedentes bacterium]|nr:aldo/keto reductase [Candidatus Hydrogenedentota bacterium]
MKYRRFGKTGLDLPVITCGGMRFQHSWNSDDAVSDGSQKNVEACVLRALELGINHFETARGYGTSEAQLGRILPRLPRQEIIVQTKVGPQADVGRFRDAFEKSMGLLNLDYIDLFAFHGINNDEALEHAMGCLEQARTWQREGRIRHIGFSSHGSQELITKAVRSGAFAYVNLHWFYIFQENWPAIHEARKRDMGVFIISPSDKGGLLHRPSEKLMRLTDPLHPMVFNSLFCLSRPEVHTLSCGVSSPEHFDKHQETIKLMDRAAEVVGPIERRLQGEMERVLGKRWVRTWRKGLPQWHETPGEINIPWILRLRNLALAFDMIEFGKMRYNLLGNGGHWFPGNQAGDVENLDLEGCLRHSPHAEVIPGMLKEAHELLKGEERARLQEES